MKSKIYIYVAAPECRGAPYPSFDSKKVNESKFEDDLRAKWWDIGITSPITGYVTWEAQEAKNPTEAWENEVKRAFKANGLKRGSTIHVKFGSRDAGILHEYDLLVK